jgi:hypothetical protein
MLGVAGTYESVSMSVGRCVGRIARQGGGLEGRGGMGGVGWGGWVGGVATV